MSNDPNQRLYDAYQRSGLARPIFCERLGFKDATVGNWFRSDHVKVYNRAPEYAAKWAEANFPTGRFCPVCHEPLKPKR